jgi:hypothetical protein
MRTTEEQPPAQPASAGDQIESPRASERITEAVTAWPGVEAGPGERGSSVAFRLGRRELGHLHGDHVLHTSFPREQWSELKRDGRIDYHPVFPDKQGPAARRLETDEDVREAIALLRLNYERALERVGAAQT